MPEPQDAAGQEPGPDIRESAPQFWEPVWEFVVHGVVGTAIFLIVAGFAVLIDLLVRWLETRHAVSGEILQGLRWTSLAIFATDIFLIFVFLIKTAYRTARKL
jgi:hypothetical protein